MTLSYLVKCPKCGKAATKPERSLKNCFFKIDAYKCEFCGQEFKETSG